MKSRLFVACLAIGIFAIGIFTQLASANHSVEASAFPLEASLLEDNEEKHPIMLAWESYASEPFEVKQAILDEVITRAESLEGDQMAELLKLRDKARKKLKTGPLEAPAFYDPEVYAKGRPVNRRWASAQKAETQYSIYRVWETQPPYSWRVRYDFGRNLAAEKEVTPNPELILWDLLHGYPPGVDELVAWIQNRLDFDRKIDKLAVHFDHPYCNLDGVCFEEISIYDAFASEEKMDMPDVDVIPFAQKIAKDRSFRSPIPANSKRRKLYDKVKDGFLKYFRHRTMVEIASYLWVNPEIEIRPGHEPLRDRVLYAYFLDDGDIEKLRKRFVRGKDRFGFIDKMDDLIRKDVAWKSKGKRFAAMRNEARWAIAGVVHDVLRERGYLND